MVSLLGPAEIRELAENLALHPTKKLGQNFVHDANTVRKIVTIAKIQPGDHVLEIGPGLGSLTLGLLNVGAFVTAVEIDERLAHQLPHTVYNHAGDNSHLTVIHDDALHITELPNTPQCLVANLPYNVSVPVILHLLEHFPSLHHGIVMVQAEVGERLTATPGTKIYGNPSAKAAWYGRWSIASSVSREVFWPIPNVDSLLIAFQRHLHSLDNAHHSDIYANTYANEPLRGATFSLIDAAFQQRRKMLRQSLAPVFGSAHTASGVLERAGIDPTLRAEQLAVTDFLRIARVAA